MKANIREMKISGASLREVSKKSHFNFHSLISRSSEKCNGSVKTLEYGRMKILTTYYGMIQILIKETCHAAGRALKSTEQAVSNHSMV